MVRSLRQLAWRVYQQTNSSELLIAIFLLICFIHPLTLPNWYKYGYVEVDWTANFKCSFLDLSGARLDSEEYRPTSSAAAFDSKLYIETGGKYTNKHCKTADQHVAIIVPYRNRSEHLRVFVNYLHPFLVQQNAINYQLFIIEQDDDLPFNRGNLLNIGYHEALQLDAQLNCFIFHDVDILPSDLRQLYTCSRTPRHLCSYLDKFRYVLLYPELFGGVIAIQKEQFARTNGYSNVYSGWGGEDDDFYSRVKHHFGLIERYPKEIGRCGMLSHHQNEEVSESRLLLLKEAIGRSKSDGLSSLNQTYVRRKVENHPMFVKVKVSLHK